MLPDITNHIINVKNTIKGNNSIIHDILLYPALHIKSNNHVKNNTYANFNTKINIVLDTLYEYDPKQYVFVFPKF